MVDIKVTIDLGMKKIQKFFDAQAKNYDTHMQQSGHYAAQLRIIEKIQEDTLPPILDAACGSGVLVKYFSENFTFIQGNDFSKEMVVEARRTNPHTKITCEDAASLPGYTKKFRTIICCNLFYYLPNKNKALQRWRNLLENEGKLIIIEKFPFKYPRFEDFTLIVNPISFLKIKEIVEKNKFKLERKAKEYIDEHHNLYALVFKKINLPIIRYLK